MSTAPTVESGAAAPVRPALTMLGGDHALTCDGDTCVLPAGAPDGAAAQ